MASLKNKHFVKENLSVADPGSGSLLLLPRSGSEMIPDPAQKIILHFLQYPVTGTGKLNENGLQLYPAPENWKQLQKRSFAPLLIQDPRPGPSSGKLKNFLDPDQCCGPTSKSVRIRNFLQDPDP
jgi:hypothetical protein